MTSGRGLAFELSQLPVAQREQLLAELPPEARARMESLLGEISSLLGRPARDFESHLETATAQPSSLSTLNDGQIRLLLSAEAPSVQRRVSGLVRSNQLNELAPAVASVLSAYLARKVQANEIRGDVAPLSTRGWWKWKRATR